MNDFRNRLHDVVEYIDDTPKRVFDYYLDEADKSTVAIDRNRGYASRLLGYGPLWGLHSFGRNVVEPLGKKVGHYMKYWDPNPRRPSNNTYKYKPSAITRTDGGFNTQKSKDLMPPKRRSRGGKRPQGMRRGKNIRGTRGFVPARSRTTGRALPAPGSIANRRALANFRNRVRMTKMRKSKTYGGSSGGGFVMNRGPTRKLAVYPKVSNRTNGGKITRVSLDRPTYDDAVFAYYPFSGSTLNFVMIGTSPLFGADSIYPLAIWNRFYQINQLQYYKQFSEFRVTRWKLSFKTTLATSTTSGEIVTLTVPDIMKLYNRSLCFTAGAGVDTIRGAGFYESGTYISPDWTAIMTGTTPNIFGYNNIYSTVKNFVEGNPKQFSPNKDFTFPLLKYGDFKRNIPAADNEVDPSNYAWDFTAIQETESRLCCAGCLCMFGQMTDSVYYGSDGASRKIGDLWLSVEVEFRGLGTEITLQDADPGFRSFAQQKFDREFKYFNKHYTVDMKLGSKTYGELIPKFVEKKVVVVVPETPEKKLLDVERKRVIQIEESEEFGHYILPKYSAKGLSSGTVKLDIEADDRPALNRSPSPLSQPPSRPSSVVQRKSNSAK